MWQDFRYSVRLLLRHPGFTLTAISVLALGIGVNAGIFGLINGLLLRPLPGADAAGDVVGLYSHDRTTERGYRAFSYRGFSDVRDAGGPFATLAAHNVTMVGISEGNTTRQSFADIVSTRYFETLGVRADLRPRLHPRGRTARQPAARGDRQLPPLAAAELRSRPALAHRPHQRPGLRHHRRRARRVRRHHRHSRHRVLAAARRARRPRERLQLARCIASWSIRKPTSWSCSAGSSRR